MNGSEIISFVSVRFFESGANLHALRFIFFIVTCSNLPVSSPFFCAKILTVVAREFLTQVSRIGNKWNDLTLLAEGFHSPEG